MTPATRLQAALGDPDPARALRTVVLELAGESCPNQEISELLEKLLFDLRGREGHRESEEMFEVIRHWN